jgi:hypothetical protein
LRPQHETPPLFDSTHENPCKSLEKHNNPILTKHSLKPKTEKLSTAKKNQTNRNNISQNQQPQRHHKTFTMPTSMKATPLLKPATATGVRRRVTVPSPSCAAISTV